MCPSFQFKYKLKMKVKCVIIWHIFTKKESQKRIEAPDLFIKGDEDMQLSKKSADAAWDAVARKTYKYFE